MRVQRYDSGEVRGVERTPQGGIRVRAALTRVGVLNYRDTTGKQWSELRPVEEVFANDSMASARGAPLTVGHPDHKVTTATWRADSVGHACDDVAADGKFLASTLVVNDGAAVEKVDSKQLRELSCGYECDVDPTPGMFEGTHYDAIQRRIVYNHIALLPEGEGRAGPEVALRMDGAAMEVRAGTPAPAKQPALPGIERVTRADGAQEHTMRVLKIRKQEFKLDADADVAAAQGAVDDMQGQFDAVRAALLDAQTKLAVLEVSIQTDKAKSDAVAAKDDDGDEPGDADGAGASDEVMDGRRANRFVARLVLGKGSIKGKRADALRKDVSKALEARVAAETKFRADAAAVLGEKFDIASKSPDEVKRAVIAKAFPAIKLDGKSTIELEAYFNAALAAPKQDVRNEALARAHEDAIGDPSKRQDEEDPRTKMEKQREAQREAAMKQRKAGG